MSARQQLNMEYVTDSFQHLQQHHNNADGYIALFKKYKDKDGNESARQHHYKPHEIPNVLKEWEGHDFYFSQNTFYRPSRTLDCIKELRALYVDIDFYNIDTSHLPREFKGKGYNEQQIIMALEQDYFNKRIPEPNMIIHSGRGLCLIWHIEPLSHKALPMWQVVENYLVRECLPLGADVAVSDASRVLRASGSINSKNNKIVYTEHRYNELYVLEDLQEEYLPNIDIEKPTKKGIKKSTSKSAKNEQNIKNEKQKHILNVYTLHHNRLKDLNTLLFLRHGAIATRELFCFLYRYWTCFFVKDTEEALRQTLEFNSKFSKPLSEQEVIKATASAEKAFEKWNDEEANAIANENGHVKAGYNYTNQTLIDMFKIQPEEEKHLKTIITPKEKQRRDTLKKREIRGSLPEEEYRKQQKQQKNEKVEALRGLIAKYPLAKNKELAEMMSVSVRTLNRLKQQL